MKAKPSGSYVAIGIAAAIAAVLVCWRSASVEAVYPVERAKRAFSQRVWTRVTGLFRGSAAKAENVRLRREVASLALLRGDIERLEAENVRLRNALGYVKREPGRWLAAGVLSAGGGAAGAGDRIRVDKGSLAGVADGAAVVVPEGLVGRVTAVTPHTSEISLVTDASVKVACEVEADADGMRGILSGGSEDLLVLRYVSGSAAPSRARVLTSGRGGVFPRGIEVGKLLQTRLDPDGLSRECDVLPSVDYSSLEDVFIRCAK